MKSNLEMLRLRAYEYALLKLIVWFCEQKDFLNKDYVIGTNLVREKDAINSYNAAPFEMHKALILAFFVCIGNGSFRYLFTLWGKFYAYANGPYSSPIVDEIIFEKGYNMLYIKPSNDSIFVKNNGESLSEMLDKLQLEIEVLDEKLKSKLEGEYYKSSAKSTYKAISDSIAMLRKNNPIMIEVPHKSLYRISRSFSAYDRLIQLNSKASIEPQELEPYALPTL